MFIFTRLSAFSPTSPSTNPPVSGGGNSPSLFPCLVCYPGTSNYTLVWLPIDPNTAAALNPALVGLTTPTGTPQKPPTATSATTLSNSVPMVTSSPQPLSPIPITSEATSPSITPNNPMLPSNLSAAITQSYLQLLQLQQLQQQSLQNPPLKQEVGSPLTSLLPHASSLGVNSSDILTQAISGSIPATSNSGRTPTTSKVAGLSLSGATQSSSPHSSG